MVSRGLPSDLPLVSRGLPLISRGLPLISRGLPLVSRGLPWSPVGLPWSPIGLPSPVGLPWSPDCKDTLDGATEVGERHQEAMQARYPISLHLSPRGDTEASSRTARHALSRKTHNSLCGSLCGEHLMSQTNVRPDLQNDRCWPDTNSSNFSAPARISFPGCCLTQTRPAFQTVSINTTPMPTLRSTGVMVSTKAHSSFHHFELLT